jgi:hypothetical protein
MSRKDQVGFGRENTFWRSETLCGKPLYNPVGIGWLRPTLHSCSVSASGEPHVSNGASAGLNRHVEFGIARTRVEGSLNPKQVDKWSSVQNVSRAINSVEQAKKRIVNKVSNGSTFQSRRSSLASFRTSRSRWVGSWKRSLFRN